MKRLRQLTRRGSEERTEAIIQDALREGYLELVGFDHGEPIYRTTEKGRKFLEEYNKQRR